MKTMHVHWFDEAEKPAATLARAFQFDLISLEDREVLWAKIIQGLWGGDEEFVEGQKAVTTLLPNAERHRTQYDRERKVFTFRTRHGVQVKLTVPDYWIVILDVDFRRESTHYALSLACRLVARPVVLAVAAATRASMRHSGPWVSVMLHDPDANKCNRCDTALCT